MCYTYLHLPSMGTSVPEALGHTFYATRRHVYCMFDTDGMTSVSTLVWYHTQKNTRNIQGPTD